MATAPILASNEGRVNIPTGPFLDSRGNINPAWQIWLLNPNVQSLQAAAPLTPYSGGLGVSTTPAIGQLPVATSTGVYQPSPFTSLPLFTSTTPGLAPASGGGTVNFLRADGAYASPVAGSAGQVQYNSSGTFAASALFTYDGAGLLGVSNITGTALGMTIRPKTPTVLETAGTLFLFGQNAVKANTNGGAITLTTGVGNGSGVTGALTMGLGDASSSLYMDAAAGLQFTGNLTSAFTIDATGGIAFTAGTGSDFATINFNAGVNAASTGSNPISFTTDSGAQLSLTEATFGSPIAVLGLSSGKVGFYGTAGVTKAAAYTKTYSTASRTIPNATFSNLSTTAATNAAPWGFSTQAQADAIATKVNQLGADVLILKQLIVALVNDSSSALGVGLNAT